MLLSPEEALHKSVLLFETTGAVSRRDGGSTLRSIAAAALAPPLMAKRPLCEHEPRAHVKTPHAKPQFRGPPAKGGRPSEREDRGEMFAEPRFCRGKCSQSPVFAGAPARRGAGGASLARGFGPEG